MSLSLWPHLTTHSQTQTLGPGLSQSLHLRRCVCVCVCVTCFPVSEWPLLYCTHCTVYTDIRIGKHGQSGLTTTAAVADLTNQSCRRESHDLEQLTQDMLVCLQSTEMSVHHYCSQLVAVVAAHIGGGLTRAGVREGGERGEGGEGREGGTAEVKVTASINACLKLLASLVELFEVHLRTLLRLFHHSSSFSYTVGNYSPRVEGRGRNVCHKSSQLFSLPLLVAVETHHLQ